MKTPLTANEETSGKKCVPGCNPGRTDCLLKFDDSVAMGSANFNRCYPIAPLVTRIHRCQFDNKTDLLPVKLKGDWTG